MTLRPALLLLLSFFTALQAEEDFRPAVRDALKRGEKQIVIPKGVYRLAPESGGELWALEGARDVEIVAEGVTLVGTKLIRALSLHRCTGVSLSGLTVDYDPLPFTQGTVIAEAEDGDHIDVKIHAGYPRKPYARIDVIDPMTRFRKKGMPFLWGSKAEMIGEDLVRVKLKGLTKTAKTGDLVSLSTGQEMGAPHAISIDQCNGIHFRNITVHSAPGMGILEADGEGGSSFNACRIVSGPKPPGATEERLLSSSWDAFQSKTVRKGPRIEDCEITHAGDDSWSVQSSDFLVLKSDGKALVLASRDEYTAGVQDGDRIRQGLEGPEFRITSRRTAPRAEAALPADVLEKLAQAKTWDDWKVSPTCILVTLDRESSLKPGDCVYSPDRMGNGFVFRNNRVHSPGRILLKAGGLMEGNTLDTPHALIVCPELPGSGAAGIEDLVIRGNVIRNGGWFCAASWSSQAGIVSLTATGDAKELRSVPVFKNIRIEDNRIEGGSGPQLVISSAKDVVVTGNRFVSAQHEKGPDTGASYRIPADAVVWTTKCEGVSFEKNRLEAVGPFAGEQVILK